MIIKDIKKSVNESTEIVQNISAPQVKADSEFTMVVAKGQKKRDKKVKNQQTANGRRQIWHMIRHTFARRLSDDVPDMF